MSETITWYFTQKWGISTVDWELVKPENINWAIDGDKVKARKIEEWENSYSFEILNVLKSTNEHALEVIEWVYKKVEWTDYGYINNPWESKWIKVFDEKANWAKDWDIVIWKINEVWWKSQATIKTILDVNVIQSVWTYHNWKILLDNGKKLRIRNNDYDLENWDVAVVVLDEMWIWTVASYLWKKWDKWVDYLKIAYEEWASLDFPREVLKDVKKLRNLCTPEEIEKREDLREMFTITIDGSDTKDIDDAISMKELENWGFILYTHIADVSHYVEEGSAIDNEAKDRWTSTYFVDHVIPMLPEELSNDLCSLNPNTDKLTKTCETELNYDEKWKLVIKDVKIYNSVINSDYRTTYKEIQELKDGNWVGVWDELMFGWVINNTLKEFVSNSFELSDALAKERLKNWELNFDTPQPKIEIDDFWNPIWFKEYQMYDSMEVIKSLMVITNVAVNSKYWNGPFLHRVHKKPSEEKIDSLVDVMSYFGLDMKWFKWYSSQFSNLLNKLKWHPKEKFLHRFILRSMKRAVVSEQREEHFWLWIDGEETGYTWFTSPIRRYADLQIHRIIWDSLSEKDQKIDAEKEAHYNNIMQEIALKVTIKERKAEDVAVKVNYYAALKYMKDKIWEEFKWMITDVTDEWEIFIELDNTIAWKALVDTDNINIEEIVTDFYKIDDLNWNIYTPWDDISLELASVNLEDEEIYFYIINNEAA